MHNRIVHELLKEEERHVYRSVNDVDQELKRVPERLQRMERALSEAQHQANVLSLEKSRMEELLVESLVSSVNGMDAFDRLADFLGNQLDL